MNLEQYRPGKNHQPAPWAPRAKIQPQAPVADERDDTLINVALIGAFVGICALIQWIFPFDTNTCVGSCRAEVMLHFAKYIGLGLLVLFVVCVTVGALAFVAIAAWGAVLAVRDAFNPAKVYRADLGGYVDAASDGIVKAVVVVCIAVGLFWAVVIAVAIIANHI